ncbi:MAG: hypothetical protein GC161_04020 [Planctomycetaceae bacterium]|nr:hypothetical protein [Planctomycetaceae bacterium]
MNGCDAFRAQLLAWLEAPLDPARRSALRLDAHPTLCGECRRLLEEEEGLEHWLELLEHTNAAPSGLTARILARLERQRDLEPVRALLDRLPEPEIPHGLAKRVLERVRREDAVPVPLAQARPRRRRSPWLVAVPLAAAAAVFAAFYLDRTVPSGGEPQSAEQVASEAPSDELLAHLEWLEEWDLVVGEGDDLAPVLGGLDEFETWLLELAAAEAAGEVGEDPRSGTQRGERG